MPEVLLIKADFDRKSDWVEAFTGFDLEVRYWDSPGAAEDITYALVWQPEAGALAAFPNLKLIFSIGAGIDHLIGDNILPSGIPVIRMVERVLTAGMTEYVVYNVLRFHRFMPQYKIDQRNKVWREQIQVPAWQRHIGILGLGVLGTAAATALVGLGFQVAGWSRTEKHVDRVQSYYGDAQLAAFLAHTEILICLLPLTRRTENILNADLFARLPKGAIVINAGRGGHCNEADLLAALTDGQIAGAALDVCAHEPPDADSPLWQHPHIDLTPHIASMTLPSSSAEHIIDNIVRLRRKQVLTHVVDFTRGY